MGEGLSATPARLDRRGLLRAHGVRVQHEPTASEVGPVSLSGESELRVTDAEYKGGNRLSYCV